MIGPALFAYVFSHAIEKGGKGPIAGAPFFLGAGLLAAALLLAWWVTRARSGSATQPAA
jgi:hypothetical protein